MQEFNFRPAVGNGTADYILIGLSRQVSIPGYRFKRFLGLETRCGGCTNKNCFNFASVRCRNATSDRRSGTGTADYILIGLSRQVSIPGYRFKRFLGHETRCGGCTKKNCLNSRYFQRFCDFRGVRLIFRMQFEPHNSSCI